MAAGSSRTREGDNLPERVESTIASADRIGPYRLGKVLGRGGMGVVFEAEDPASGRTVAVKLLTTLRMDDPVVLRRFEREAAIATKLRHPGICPILDAGAAGGIPYIVMPLLRGRPLDAWLRDRGCATAGEPGTLHDTVPLGEDGGYGESTRLLRPESPGEAVRIVIEALRALQYAHESGVIHRDLKPANLFLCEDGSVKILDFGLARDLASGPVLTQSSDVFGTPAYMSPEQVTGARHVDARSDVWSMGVTLFELLTFRRPFTGPTQAALFSAIQRLEPPDPMRCNPAVDATLSTILRVALAKDPLRRFASAKAFADDLEAWSGGGAIAARAPSPLYRLRRWARNHPSTAALCAVLLVGLPAVASLGTSWILNREKVRLGERALVEQRIDEILALGFLDFGEGDPERLLAAADEALALRPAEPLALFARLLALRRKGDLDGLERELARDAPVPPLVDRLFRAALLGDRGSGREAAALLAAIGEPRDHVEHYVRASMDMDEAGGFAADRALAGFKEAMLRADRPRVLYFIGRLEAAAALGDSAEVDQAGDALRTRFSGVRGAEFAIGLAMAATGRHAGALEAFERALSLDPRNGELLARAGVSQMHAGGTERAREMLGAAIEAAPGSPVVHAAMGRFHLHASNPAEALARFDEAIALHPGLPFVHAMRSHALWDLGRTDESIESVRKARELDPKNGKYARDHGARLARAGRWDEAREIFAALVETHPWMAAAHEGLARCHYHGDETGPAIDRLARAVELAPGDLDYRRSLCTVLCEDGRGGEAAAHLAVLREHGGAGDGMASYFVEALLRAAEFGEAELWMQAMQALPEGASQLPELRRLEAGIRDGLARAAALLGRPAGEAGLAERLRAAAAAVEGMPAERDLLRRLRIRLAAETRDPADLEAAAGI